MSRTLFCRYTDVNNNVHVDSHQVWDVDRFCTARSNDAREANAKAMKDKKEGFASFTVISEAEYKALK